MYPLLSSEFAATPSGAASGRTPERTAAAAALVLVPGPWRFMHAAGQENILLLGHHHAAGSDIGAGKIFLAHGF